MPKPRRPPQTPLGGSGGTAGSVTRRRRGSSSAHEHHPRRPPPGLDRHLPAARGARDAARPGSCTASPSRASARARTTRSASWPRTRPGRSTPAATRPAVVGPGKRRRRRQPRAVRGRVRRRAAASSPSSGRSTAPIRSRRPASSSTPTVGAPNVVTWQPREGVRVATVTARWGGGTVMAGRSLREVERREDQALLLVAARLGRHDGGPRRRVARRGGHPSPVTRPKGGRWHPSLTPPLSAQRGRLDSRPRFASGAPRDDAVNGSVQCLSTRTRTTR